MRGQAQAAILEDILTSEATPGTALTSQTQVAMIAIAAIAMRLERIMRAA
jgi:hypothetical protein